MSDRHPSNSTWQQRNAALLRAYADQPSPERRNAVVQANLPLVWQTARRESLRSGHSFEDLCQVGAIGLIKAVERYDPDQGASLSTAALPWISGAIRQYLRDRTLPLQGCRSLRELRQRARQLQQRHGQSLSEAQLIAALGCSPALWREAQAVEQALRLASLEQPLPQSDGSWGCLKEQLIDQQAADPYATVLRGERRRLLWRALRGLDPAQRRLLLGRVLQQRPWQELGQHLGLSGRVAQRRFSQLLRQLQEQLAPHLEVGMLG